ncbi:MAG: hypothetical protein ACLP4W_14570 [Mycobacterium sp.]|uniref:hypothetical protein n=1 Tax=Mycobacterium sp. TaxID=1785 RepID=UPI003F9D0404
MSVDLERILFVEQIQIEQLVRHMPIVIQTDTNTRPGRDFARLSRSLGFDDSSDDNRDDSGSLNTIATARKRHSRDSTVSRGQIRELLRLHHARVSIMSGHAGRSCLRITASISSAPHPPRRSYRVF